MREHTHLHRRLLEAARIVNEVLGHVESPALRRLENACHTLEVAYERWGDTEPKIMRTWLSVAAEELQAAADELKDR